MKKFYVLLIGAILSNSAISMANTSYYEEVRSERHRGHSAHQHNPFSASSGFGMNLNRKDIKNTPQAEDSEIEAKRRKVQNHFNEREGIRNPHTRHHIERHRRS